MDRFLLALEDWKNERFFLFTIYMNGEIKIFFSRQGIFQLQQEVEEFWVSRENKTKLKKKLKNEVQI